MEDVIQRNRKGAAVESGHERLSALSCEKLLKQIRLLSVPIEAFACVGSMGRSCVR